MKPKFPLVQIDEKKWTEGLIDELFRFDQYYCSRDKEFYYTYLYNGTFLDSEGHLFLAKEKIIVNNFWSKLGLGKKFEITFEKRNEKWSFEEVKTFLLSRIKELSLPEGKKGWVEAIESAKTIKELIEAPR